MSDYERLSMNQVTNRDRWSLREAIEGYSRHGIRAIGVWHDKLAEVGAGEAARMLRDHGMTVTGYCFGGMLADAAGAEFERRLDDNRRLLDEAAEIGSRCLVLVAGGLPEGSTDLPGARARCLEGLEVLLAHARGTGTVIGLEPLHPMICATRSVLTTLKLANDWYEVLGGGPELGVVVDTYATWWDPDLEAEIERAAGRIVAFHVSDWLVDTRDIRLDRGMMGDGVIDIPHIRRLVEAAGYDGHREVEILSARDWWKRDPDEVCEISKQRYLSHV